MKPKYVVLVVALAIFASCKKESATPPPTTPIIPVTPVDTSLQKFMPFKIGVSVDPSQLQNNAKYRAVVLKEYNSITAENHMKFAAIHTAPNTFNWTQADYIVSFAQTNNLRLHGHTLLWHSSVPNWVNTFTGDSAAFENMVKTYIQTLVTRFKGKVVSWDVVNEAFEENGDLRNSVWRQRMGSDYIARCFKYAAEADSTALLFYNDYNHEYSAAKRTAITNLITNLKSRNIPIHGTGLQFHLTHTVPDANITAALSNAVATGLKVHISELDIRVNDGRSQTATFSAALSSQQSAKYKAVVKAYKNTVPAAQQFGITLWNVGDADSWIPGWQNAPDWPLPFDANYNRKPAYYGMLDGLK